MCEEFQLEIISGKKFYIKQSEDYKFTIDPIILGNFVKLRKNLKVLDLGCATGILEFVLASREQSLYIKGIELQDNLFNKAVSNIKRNNLENIDIVQGDYLDKDIYKENESYDLIISNPPYVKLGSGKLPENKGELIAKFEYKMNFENMVKMVNRLIKDNGSFSFIHKSTRLYEIINILNKYKFGVRRLQTVHSNINSPAHLVLVDACKKINIETKVMKPNIIYDESGNYYGKFKELF